MRNIGKSITVIILSVICSYGVKAAADVKLPGIVGEGMVLQRDTVVNIWGWADPGEQVSVVTDWPAGGVYKDTADKDGKWMVEAATPKAGGPYEITVKGKNEIKLKDVLVGEVWVCSGQSNMQWNLRNSKSWENEKENADIPGMRLFKVALTASETPLDDCEGSWQRSDQQSASEFSGVGYFFGKYIHERLGVPVGMVQSAWGGTPAEAWMEVEIIESDDEFRPILDMWADFIAREDEFQKQYEQQLEEWEVKAEKAKSEGKNPPRRPFEPGPLRKQNRPAYLYNGMIKPILNYTIQGAIWYQGESNAGRAYQYRRLFPAMIANWRERWGLGEFPFYFVEIAPFNYGTEGVGAEIREAQFMTLKSSPNTGMASTMGIGNCKDIHPTNKRDVGKRLALIALANTYGQDWLVSSGPSYTHYRIEGDKIRLFFDHVGSGLVFEGGEPDGFEICGPDKKFYPARAIIDGGTVVISSDNVSGAVAARYGWENCPKASLYNRESLPASPFRTDDWPGVTYGKFR